MEFDLWIVMGLHPERQEMVPMAVSLTEAGAYDVAAEAADAITLSYSISDERHINMVAEIVASMKVIPGNLYVDPADLHDD